MRLQLSFEFMLYLVVGSVSLTAALAFTVTAFSKESASASTYSMEQFASIVNSNTGYYSSQFYAYVPKAVCNSSYLDESGFFDARVEVSNSLCSASGRILRLESDYIGNGTYILNTLGVYS